MIAMAADHALELAQPSGVESIIRVSSIIIMPSWSQASSNSGVGGLCEVR